MLSKYDNSNKHLPVFVGINGKVYDVSSNRKMYPHGNGYGILAGCDASRLLAFNTIDEKMRNGTLDDLTQTQRESLQKWQEFYEKKYPCVGILK